MSRLAKVVSTLGLAGALAMGIPAAANAATPSPQAAQTFTWAACIAPYAFFSDTPGSPNYTDYCGYGDLVEVVCKTLYSGDYWYGAIYDEQYSRGYVDGVNLYVPDPTAVPAC